MSINTKDVEKLAHLSRLEFADEAKEEIAGELYGILDFISKLQEVDTEGVEPMTSVMSVNNEDGNAVATPEREDEVTEEDNRENLQQGAPNADMGFYVVPKVIE